MSEYSAPPVEEPDGFRSIPSYVKSRPENNAHYVDQLADDPWFEIISECASELENVVPGYNISQIKMKFGGLRFYISQGNCPDDVWKANGDQAQEIIRVAERAVDRL